MEKNNIYKIKTFNGQLIKDLQWVDRYLFTRKLIEDGYNDNEINSFIKKEFSKTKRLDKDKNNYNNWLRLNVLKQAHMDIDKKNIIKEKVVLGDKDREMINNLETQIKRGKKLKNNYKKEINIAKGFIVAFIIIILIQFLLYLDFSLQGKEIGIFYFFATLIICVILPSMQIVNNLNSISKYKREINKINIVIEFTYDIIKKIRGN